MTLHDEIISKKEDSLATFIVQFHGRLLLELPAIIINAFYTPSPQFIPKFSTSVAVVNGVSAASYCNPNTSPELRCPLDVWRRR